MNLRVFLEALATPRMIKYFTEGGCYELYKIIKQFFPDAVAYYDPIDGHVFTLVGDTYYDIRDSYGSLGDHIVPLDEWIALAPFTNPEEWSKGLIPSKV